MFNVLLDTHQGKQSPFLATNKRYDASTAGCRACYSENEERDPMGEDVLAQQRQNFHEHEWSSFKLISGVESFTFPKGWETKMVNEDDVWSLKEHFKQMTHDNKHNNKWSAKYGS